MHEAKRAMTQLQKTLGPVLIWGLGVGYVISGMYFGWNLGLPEGGPYGLLLATVVVTVLYVSFVLGYAELACALPRAGGVFVYPSRAVRPHVPGVRAVGGVPGRRGAADRVPARAAGDRVRDRQLREPGSTVTTDHG